VFGEKEFNLVVSPIHPLFRRHKGPFNAGLTDGALSAQVFGEKEFNLVVSPIHPFLGDIKVLSMLQQTHTGAALAKGRAQRAKLPFRSFPRPNRYRERIFREGSNPLRVKLFLPPIWHGFARSCSRSRAKRTPSGQIVKHCFFNYHSIFFRTLFKTASVTHKLYSEN
jgi:hypothetical protein